jgi:GntR family transcriptional regulator
VPHDPAYVQIKRWILGQIDSGALAEGSMLAPEQELAAKLGVSRPTVRQAILGLARDGVVQRRRGVGTVVLAGRKEYPTRRLLSFTEEFASTGRKVTARLLGAVVEPAREADAGRLGEQPGTSFFVVTRVRLVEREPIAWQRSCVPHRYVPGIETIDFRDASLYEVLTSRYGFSIERAHDVIVAGVADREEADNLGIGAGDPVFRIERRSYLVDGRQVELVDSIYRADRFQIRLVVHR